VCVSIFYRLSLINFEDALPIENSMTEAHAVVVVVDPYSSGRILVQELIDEHYPIVAVRSSWELPQFWLDQMPKSDNFVYTTTFTDPESMVKELEETKGYKVLAVFAGSEPGVIVAEILQDAFKVRGNGSETSIYRRSKYAMHERLREVGLRAATQTIATNAEDCLTWQKEHGRWPIILKPSLSAATTGLYWCHNEEDVRFAFEASLGEASFTGDGIVQELLCQEFLNGTEYIVNCVSHEGRHIVTAIWIYAKERNPENNTINAGGSILLDGRGEVQDKLRKYVLQVLTALHFKNGPSHNEIMMVDGEPCLVEVNARLAGLRGPIFAELATGFGDHQLTVDIFLNNARTFEQLYASNYIYTRKKACAEMLLMSPVEGILQRNIPFDEFKKLRSYYDSVQHYKVGDRILITRTLTTNAGIIMLMSSIDEQMQSDWDTIRRMERKPGFYQVADESDVADRSEDRSTTESPHSQVECPSYDIQENLHKKDIFKYGFENNLEMIES